MTPAQVFNGAVNVPTNASNLATACALCSHNCGLRVDVADNKIVEVRADDDHPSTKGYSCNKAYAIANYVNHAQRVTQPLKKLADGSFKAISWDTAISEIAEKLNHIRKNHAPRSIAFAGLGGQGNHSSGLAAIPLMYGIGTPMVFTALAQEKTQHWLNDRRMIRGTNDIYLTADKHHAKFMCTGYEKWEFSIFPKDIIAPQVRPPVVNPMGQALPEVEIYYRLARAMGLVGAAPKFLHRLAKQARKPLMTPAYLAAVNSYALASSKLQGVGAIVARSAFLMYETLGKTLPNPMLAYIWLLTLGYASTRRDQVIRALSEAKAMLNPFALTEYLFAKILANPQGVLLGHYEIEHNFEYYSKHQDGKIRLYFADYAQDLSRLIAQDVEPDEKDYPFVLNGGLRTGFTANTIMRDPSWRKGRAIHASLYMSEADAAALNAKEGDLVKISSKRSSVIAPVKVDKNTLTGHLHLPNILGQYYPDPVTGELKANGIAINELVDLTDRDPYTGCPHTKRIRCKVELVN